MTLADRFLIVAASAIAAAACETGGPPTTPTDATDTVEDHAPTDDADAPADDGDGPTCEPLPGDYLPRVDGSAGDDWPPCISDDNRYHRIEETITTIARVAQFEQIAALLWSGRVPSPDDFTEARVIYATDQGLDSRVQRREDHHYPPVPAAEGTCRDPGVPARYPDRCAGPARILPILNDAFAAGMTGSDARVNAARIEAALLWFLYLSVYKEAFTCTEMPRDCDSCWAYYTGGEARDAGLGLSRYVRRLDPATHDRVWDGALAVRCWKNLDNETGISTDATTRDRAIAQMDRALIRGVALIARERMQLAVALSGDERRAAWEFSRILGGVLNREAAARNPGIAEVLRSALAAAAPDEADVSAAIAAIDSLFPCP